MMPRFDSQQKKLFDLNCVAFGVGEWTQFIGLDGFGSTELEWLAHERLGVCDLRLFWKRHILPDDFRCRASAAMQCRVK